MIDKLNAEGIAKLQKEDDLEKLGMPCVNQIFGRYSREESKKPFFRTN